AGLDAELSDEAGDQRRRFLGAGGWARGPQATDAVLQWCDVAVDCLLGTGATGAPRGVIGEAVAALRRARHRGTSVVACDVPTGVQADDGQVPGEAVSADLTVTFGGLKRGVLLYPGAKYAGRVAVGDLGEAYQPPEVAWSALTAAGAAPQALPVEVDKHARGRVLVVAGSRGMAGAAVLCARGALAAGAGLVTVAVPRGIQDLVAGLIPPALTVGLDDAGGAVAATAADAIRDAAADADVVVAGPGMTFGSGTRQVIDALRRTARRLVLDADALNAHRGETDVLADHAGELVVTPQHRELARLVEDATDGDDALRRRAELAPPLAARLRATVVAKGPTTVVAAPDQRVWVTPTGGPALAAGGTGDVLAGMVAAGCATADDVPHAVAQACWRGGLAGQLAGVTAADRSTSVDMAEAVPAALALTVRLAHDRPTWPFDAPGWRAGRTPADDAPSGRRP
ncbi:MAG: NAD(P)H-hydrate dehydratase, partial [Actinomycetota bacterium]|nr:NAD(P)H-hydrate dehydratase [Actinomycetota bacterium]